MSDMLKFLKAVDNAESGIKNDVPGSNGHADMKKLLEAVTLVEGKTGEVSYDEPKAGRYANEADEETIDSTKMSGDDLHKPKRSYKKAAGGDNPMNIKEGIRNKLESRWQKIKESSSVNEGRPVRDPTALKVKKMAIDFFDSPPYSSGRISGGRMYRISIPIDHHLSRMYRFTPVSEIDSDDFETMQDLRAKFINLAREAGIDHVDVQFHVRSGVYASIRIPIYE